MPGISVAQAAERLDVSVPRIHRRIADGSLRAERIGSQWVVDELSVLRVAEQKEPGRPLSSRSVWAIIELAEGDQAASAARLPFERSRARARLDDLLVVVNRAPKSEQGVRRIASALRLMFRNRAERVLYRAAAVDLPKLREDGRWESLVDLAISGIASVDVEGYLALENVEAVSRDYLLMPDGADANVVIHVLPAGQKSYPGSKLLLAADLADQRSPREELRAAEMVRELAIAQAAVTR